MPLTLDEPAPRGYVFTFVGDAGTGKTTLAAQFPKPVFIQSERGLMDQAIARFPFVNHSNDVIGYINQLGTEEHDFQTLVIDSVTMMDSMIEREVLQENNAPSLAVAGNGYGHGYQMVASKHQLIRQWCEVLSIAGMHVVFVAHQESEMVKPPDSEDYTRVSIKMHRRSLANYIDNVDLVGLVRLKSITRTTKDQKRRIAISEGQRELVCHAQAAAVTKNRFGISEPLPMPVGVNPLASIITDA